MTFTDDHTVLLSWNQQAAAERRRPEARPTAASRTRRSRRSPRRIRSSRDRCATSPSVATPSTCRGRRASRSTSPSRTTAATTWTDCKVASGATVKGGTAGFAVADHDSAGNVYVVWADSSDYHTWLSVVPAAQLAACNQSIDAVAATADGEPTVDAGLRRRPCRSTATPCARPSSRGSPQAARRAASRSRSTARRPTATRTRATSRRAWNVYVNQSLNALDATRTFSQVKATTHPFHYDSICLNGLGCDLAVAGRRPHARRLLRDRLQPGERQALRRLRPDNKKPDESLGHVATPMVATQIAGPSNGGTTVATTGHAAVRTLVDRPDRRRAVELLADGARRRAARPADEERAGRRLHVGVGRRVDAATGGFTVTLKVADLSTASLTQALADTGGPVARSGSGGSRTATRTSAASVRWNPLQGFTFGWNDYTAGGSPCVIDDERAGRQVRRLPGRPAAAGHGRPARPARSR